MNEKDQILAALPYLDDDEVYPVTRITAAAVGDPGYRIFVLQAHIGSESFSWVIEKELARVLSRELPALLKNVHQEFPELGAPLVAAQPNLELTMPLEPLFRVGTLGVDYDRLHDLVVLTLVDAEMLRGDGDLEDLEDEDEPGQRVFTTRGQALLLGQQAERIVAAGRPSCPRCSEPIDDFGHFCLPLSARNPRTGEYTH